MEYAQQLFETAVEAFTTPYAYRTPADDLIAGFMVLFFVFLFFLLYTCFHFACCDNE